MGSSFILLGAEKTAAQHQRAACAGSVTWRNQTVGPSLRKQSLDACSQRRKTALLYRLASPSYAPKQQTRTCKFCCEDNLLEKIKQIEKINVAALGRLCAQRFRASSTRAPLSGVAHTPKACYTHESRHLQLLRPSLLPPHTRTHIIIVIVIIIITSSIISRSSAPSSSSS